MRYAGLGFVGRTATRLATLFAGPFRSRYFLANLYRKGYIAPTATIHHADLRLGDHVFIADRVLIYQHATAGPIELGHRVHLCEDTIIEIGAKGALMIGSDTWVQQRCHFEAYRQAIRIGRGVQIGPSCAFYNFDHGIRPGEPIGRQPIHTKGPIVIEDDAWLGGGVIVLAGVRIGKGAVIGAGAVVTRDVPDGAIAVGVPARVNKMRAHPERPAEAMIVRHADGTIHYWSKEAELMYGWTPREVLGLRTHDLFKTQFPDSFAAIERQLREQTTWRGRLVHQCRGGATIRVDSCWQLQHNPQTRSLIVVETNALVAA